MNITTELIDLYTTAKAAEKLDLSFRILAHFTKIKPHEISLDILSNDDLERLIEECNALNSRQTISQINTLMHVHTQAKAPQDPPP